MTAEERIASLEDQLKQALAQQRAFEQQWWTLCQPYMQTEAPQQTLCTRVERFLPELFVFVAVPGVPAHNNLAERSVRPLVIARKISGGSRSPKGSQTRMGVASLFGTWMAEAPQSFPPVPRSPDYQILLRVFSPEVRGNVSRRKMRSFNKERDHKYPYPQGL